MVKAGSCRVLPVTRTAAVMLVVKVRRANVKNKPALTILRDERLNVAPATTRRWA